MKCVVNRPLKIPNPKEKDLALTKKEHNSETFMLTPVTWMLSHTLQVKAKLVKLTRECKTLFFSTRSVFRKSQVEDLRGGVVQFYILKTRCF